MRGGASTPAAAATAAARGTWCALALAAWCAAMPTADAAEWRFDPVFTLQVQHNDDPLITTDPDDPDADPTVEGRRSDQVISLDVLLTTSRATPRSELVLRLQPTLEKYVEQDQLDNVSYYVALDWTFDPTPRTTLGADVSFTRWERTRIDLGDPTLLQPATGRSRYDAPAASVSLENELTERTRLLAGASYRATLYDNLQVRIDLDEDGTLLVDAEDANAADARIGLSHRLSPLADWRLTARGSRLDEGLYGVTSVIRGELAYVYGSAERWTFEINAGAASSSLDEAPDPILGLAADAEEDSDVTEPIGRIGFRRRIGNRPGGSLTLGASRDLTGSGGIVGASVTESAYLTVTWPVGRFSALTLAGSGSRFDPLADVGGREPTKTYGVRAEYAAAFNQHWSVVTTAEYQNQDSPVSTQLTLDYWIAGVGLRWAPTARLESLSR